MKQLTYSIFPFMGKNQADPLLDFINKHYNPSGNDCESLYQKVKNECAKRKCPIPQDFKKALLYSILEYTSKFPVPMGNFPSRFLSSFLTDSEIAFLAVCLSD